MHLPPPQLSWTKEGRITFEEFLVGMERIVMDMVGGVPCGLAGGLVSFVGLRARSAGHGGVASTGITWEDRAWNLHPIRGGGAVHGQHYT